MSTTWLTANSEIPKETLHALGVISFRWNSCEFGLKMLFSLVTDVGFKKALLLSQDMGPVTISNIIRDSDELQKMDPDISDAVLYALELFDANRQNRNQLTHYFPTANEFGKWEFRKNKVLGGIEGEIVPNSIRDVRRVADEIKALRSYLGRLCNHMNNFRYNEDYPLPEKPPLPDLLAKPRLPDAVRRKPRREPSQPRLTEREWIAKYRKSGRSLPDED